MSRAHVEALVFSLFGAFWLAVSLLGFRLQRRTGTKSQWRYVGLAGCALCVAVVVANLGFGVVVAGYGGSSSYREHPGGTP